MKNTPNFNLNKPEYGSSGWDKDLNENFDMIDDALNEALSSSGGHYIGDEAPLSPRLGQIWIDTSNGGVYGNVVFGLYKIYNGDRFEEIQPMPRVREEDESEYMLIAKDGRLGYTKVKGGK